MTFSSIQPGHFSPQCLRLAHSSLQRGRGQISYNFNYASSRKQFLIPIKDKRGKPCPVTRFYSPIFHRVLMPPFATTPEQTRQRIRSCLLGLLSDYRASPESGIVVHPRMLILCLDFVLNKSQGGVRAHACGDSMRHTLVSTHWLSSSFLKWLSEAIV